MKRSISLWGAVLGLSSSWICVGVPNAWAQISPLPTPTPVPQASESLKGKSNEELLHLLVGGKSTRKLEEEARRANEVKTHLPDRFWELPPKDAALTLVQDNCNLKKKPLLKISVRDEKGRPPSKGRVELRSKGGYWSMAWENLLILSSDGMKSTLEFSSIELHGPVKRSIVESALRRTTRCALPKEEARQLYEIIWWLGRIQFARPEQAPGTYEATTERIIATHSVRGELSVEPGGPRKREFTLCPAPLGECYYETFDDDLYAGFVHFVLRETLKRHGVDLGETTTAELGEETYSSADDKFMRTTKPPPPNDPAAAKWIDRMLRILKTDHYVIWDLAPFEEPLRYSDPRIDEALFGLLRRGQSPQAPNRKSGEADFDAAARAAHALARRKRPHAFQATMQLLISGNQEWRYAKEQLLEAATLLASTRPEYRQRLIEYLTTQLNELPKSPHSAGGLFDSIWRGDFREMTPLLEKMATATPDEIEDQQGSSQISPPRPVVGRFHAARRILVAWRESDPLTKVKLDAIIEASTSYSGGPAELLRQGFAVLPEGDRRAFKEFVQWLDQYRPKGGETSWYTRSLVTAFVGPG